MPLASECHGSLRDEQLPDPLGGALSQPLPGNQGAVIRAAT